MPFPAMPRWLVAGLLLTTAPALSAEGEAPLHQRIDALISNDDPEWGSIAAPAADDAEFLRRAFLDLTGTIPTADRARAFLASADADKRPALIDELLASPEHARHLAVSLDVLWMDRRPDVRVSAKEWREYLRRAVAANVPFDTLVAGVLSADGTDPKTRPAAKFVLDRDADSLQITRDVSRLFLGRDISCAQCHDHPVIDDYKQSHFYGIQAFFVRTFLFPNDKDKTASLAEKAEGEVSFTDVFDESKVEHTTPPRLPERPALKEPSFETGSAYEVEPDQKNAVRPVPKHSRFGEFASQLTGATNRAFARTAVNRFWAMFMGRGLVDPVDQDSSSNPPSHPELLDMLTDEFVARGCDVRWLIRELTLSRTYQRSSSPLEGASEAEPYRFAVAVVRPLTPEQLAFAVMEATGHADRRRAALGANLDEATLYAALEKDVGPFVAAFGQYPGEVPGDFQATLEQTLFFKHGSQIREWLKPAEGNLVGRLLAIPAPRELVKELYLSVLTRKPTDEERDEIVSLLEAAGEGRAALVSEVAWALLASAEFRFNH